MTLSINHGEKVILTLSINHGEKVILTLCINQGEKVITEEKYHLWKGDPNYGIYHGEKITFLGGVTLTIYHGEMVTSVGRGTLTINQRGHKRIRSNESPWSKKS